MKHLGVELDGIGMRSVGTTLYNANVRGCTEARRKELKTIGLKYFTDSLKATEGDLLETGGTLLNIAKMEALSKHWAKALEAMEKTITTYEEYNSSLTPDTPHRDVYVWVERQVVWLWDVSCAAIPLLQDSRMTLTVVIPSESILPSRA